jgi:hypothetical protein
MKALLFLLLAASLSAQTFVNGSRTQQGPLNYCADAGSSDTYACSLSPAIVSYAAGNSYRFKANTANTGAATLNLNSLGAVAIKKVAGGVTTDLADNDIRVNQVVDVVYDGTNFQLQSTLGNAATGGGGSISVDWYPYPQQGTHVTTNDPNNSVAVCHVIYNQNARLSYGIAFEVNTISGTCSGTCYLSFAIYDSSKNLIAVTENAESGNGTARRDINTTGLKRLVWSSGSAVSGGVFTWPVGKFWQCSMNTSAVIRLSAWTAQSWMRKDNYAGDEHGYKSITTGSPPTWGASWSGSLTYSGSGAEALDVKHLGSAP